MAKEKQTKSVVLKIATLGGIASAIYLLLGDIPYYLTLSRKGMNSKLISTALENKAKKHPVDDYKKSLDDMIFAEEEWLKKQPAEQICLEREKKKDLHAKLLTAKKHSDVYVICIHGYSSSPDKMGIYAKEFLKMGYNVLLPSMRGHGDSEENIITMGWKDRLDIVEWIQYLSSQYPDCKIILHGVSMGGATTMMVTGENLPQNVKLAIEDCGYTSAWEILGTRLTKTIKLPKFPFLYSANFINKVRSQFDLKKASSIEQVKKSNIPTLFIHGEKDTFVPYEMLNVVYDAAACPKEKLSVPDAPHARSVCAHPNLYWNSVKKFISQYL